MNIFIFLCVLLMSFIVVRIGAIAFQLTGVEWSRAKFQALSCFTGTGYTTRESEIITSDPQRRKIATTLIVLGHAGFVTMVASFANSLQPDALFSKLSVPFLPYMIPKTFLPWINIGFMFLSVFVLYKIITNRRVAAWVNDRLKKHIVKKDYINKVSFEELQIATGGYGVTQIDITTDSPVKNKTLLESGLRINDILVLAIERKGHIISNPPANMKLLLHDRVICFGKLDNIRKEIKL